VPKLSPARPKLRRWCHGRSPRLRFALTLHACGWPFGTYRRASRAKPRRYPAPITRTDQVQDNIVSFEVARSAEDAFPGKMVWRDADGKIARVVREPF
jgi:hypothetical protein